MNFFRENGAALAPCIISKVKHALNAPNRYIYNEKRCSVFYWEDACDIIGAYYHKTLKEISIAKNNYSHYIK